MEVDEKVEVDKADKCVCLQTYSDIADTFWHSRRHVQIQHTKQQTPSLLYNISKQDNIWEPIRNYLLGIWRPYKFNIFFLYKYWVNIDWGRLENETDWWRLENDLRMKHIDVDLRMKQRVADLRN